MHHIFHEIVQFQCVLENIGRTVFVFGCMSYVGFKNEYQINFIGRLFYARRFFGAQKFFGAQNWCIDIICNISTLSHTPYSSVLVCKCWIFVCCLECKSHFSNMLCWYEVFLMCRVHLKSSSRCNNPDKYIKSIACAKRVQSKCHFNSKAHNTNTQFEIRCIHFQMLKKSTTKKRMCITPNGNTNNTGFHFEQQQKRKSNKFI